MQLGRIPGTWNLVSLSGPPPITAPAPRFTRPSPPPPPPKKKPSGLPLKRRGDKPAEMNVDFDPAESKTVDRCDRITFVQTCQIFADGRLIIKPSQFFAGWRFRDAWTLPNGVFLDMTDTAPDQYYEMGIEGRHKDNSEKSDVISEPALFGDAPFLGDNGLMFDPAKSPKGFKTVTFKLEFFATCRAGKDFGHFYQGATWEWKLTAEEHQSGGRGKSDVTALNVETPSSDFLTAFAKYKQVKGITP